MPKKRIVFEVSERDYRDAGKRAKNMRLRSPSAFARWYFYLGLDNPNQGKRD